MPLSADAQALLELILAKGQSYEDLAGLLDTSADEVRDRAREALRELAGGVDPDRNVGLTDFLLGQADPIDRAEAARHLREDSEDNQLAAALADALGELAPDAELPRIPGAPGSGRRPKRTKARPASKPDAPQAPAPRAAPAKPAGVGWLSSPETHRTRLIVGLGSAAVLLIVIVLAVTGAFDSDGDGTSSASQTASTTDAAATTETLASIPLRPSGDGGGDGQAVIGQTSTDAVYLDLNIRDVPIPERGEAYLLWFLLSEDEGTVVPTPIPIDEDGNFQDRLSLPASMFEIVSRTRFLDLALTTEEDLTKITDAIGQSSVIFPFVGQSILRGEVPLPKSAQGEGG